MQEDILNKVGALFNESVSSEQIQTFSKSFNKTRLADYKQHPTTASKHKERGTIQQKKTRDARASLFNARRFTGVTAGGGKGSRKYRTRKHKKTRRRVMKNKQAKRKTRKNKSVKKKKYTRKFSKK